MNFLNIKKIFSGSFAEPEPLAPLNNSQRNISPALPAVSPLSPPPTPGAVPPPAAPGSVPPPPPPSNNHMIYRTIDGSGNNLLHTDMNAAGSDFTRIGPAHFADGISSLRSGPNARDISNIVVAGNGDTPDPHGLSAYMYAWGQFIDHDLDLAKSGTTDISIQTSASDPIFAGSPIALTRNAVDPKTGAGTTKPATTINTITGWLDASMIYGSDATTAANLRTSDGHLKTSTGNNLPISNDSFVAGDVRAAENPDLTSLQTLFVREHNYQADKLAKQNPSWTAEQIYQQAKAIVTAEIQHITYTEFLPHLLGSNAIAAYAGYRSNVNASITEEFAGAAYRLGHSLVSGNLASISENGTTLAAQELKNAFLEPASTFLATSGGADGFLRNLANDRSNALDVHIIDDLRNFLFSPGEGQDLAAINIQRGRDLGLGTLNETRISLGLDPYRSFSQLTSDSATATALSIAYNGDINSVDLWIGGLAENPSPGAMVGQTFGAIIAKQFTDLRDGDRYWYQNQGFDAQTLNQINNTSLADIILRDTDTKFIQSDVFVAYERDSGTLGGNSASDTTISQLVIGSNNGDDTLLGGSAKDILVAGLGQQTLTGGNGNDTFVFQNGLTQATITDFQVGHDIIELLNPQAKGFADLQIHMIGQNTTIDVGSTHLNLLGVQSNQLSNHDFIFGGGNTTPLGV